jgi:hypothetical protein
MIKLSWTAPVNDPKSPGARSVGRHDLWEILLAKAENPLNYVPAITECRVLERDGDRFLREIVRNGERIVQLVTPEPEKRLLFSHIDDPDVASIANIIDEDEQGELTFTIEVTLAPVGLQKSLAQSEFLHVTDEYFTDTLKSIIGAIRPLAAVAGNER